MTRFGSKLDSHIPSTPWRNFQICAADFIASKALKIISDFNEIGRAFEGRGLFNIL